MKRIKGILLIGGTVLLSLIIINISIYVFSKNVPIDIGWEIVNEPVNEDHIHQDNYICYREENGLKDLPFVMGCKIILQSIESEQKHIIIEAINPLKGVQESAITGDNLLYYGQFMGEQTIDSLKTINLKSKKSEWHELDDDIGYIKYGIAGGQLYYYQPHASVVERAVYCYDLKKGESKKVAECNQWENLKIIDQYVYLFDQGKKELVALSTNDYKMRKWKIQMVDNRNFVDIAKIDNHNLAIIIFNERILSLNTRTGEQKTILSFDSSDDIKKHMDDLGQWSEACTHKGNLYFCDKGWYPRLYKLNLKSGKTKLILDGIKDNPYKNKKDSDEMYSYVTFCNDYIVCIYGYKKAQTIRVFDYSGKFVKELR